jgi:hypothetical protein
VRGRDEHGDRGGEALVQDGVVVMYGTLCGACGIEPPDDGISRSTEPIAPEVTELVTTETMALNERIGEAVGHPPPVTRAQQRARSRTRRSAFESWGSAGWPRP